MATMFNTQQIPATLAITNAAGQPAPVDGIPVWASSDETVLGLTVAADGMSATAAGVALGTARITVSADADLGTGVVPITGVSEDVTVSADPSAQASLVTLTLGAPVAKT